MKSVPFKKLDAFAANGSSGNPAGAVYLADPNELSPPEMQTIARELAGFVSEVGFLARLAPTEYWIRYYSSEREVAFCGHATIAIMYDLLTSTPDLLPLSRVRISTKNEQLTVENHIADADCVFVTAPRPRFGAWKDDMRQLGEALRIPARSLRTDRPVSRVNAGLETLIVPIRGLTDLLSLAPELQPLKAFCVNHAIDIVKLLARTNPQGEKDVLFGGNAIVKIAGDYFVSDRSI